MLLCPSRETGRSCRQGIAFEESCHQSVNLLTGEKDVALEHSDEACDPVSDRGRYGDNRTTTSDGLADRDDQLTKGERLGADRVQDPLAILETLPNGQLFEVSDVDWSNAVVSATGDAEHGKVP